MYSKGRHTFGIWMKVACRTFSSPDEQSVKLGNHCISYRLLNSWQAAEKGDTTTIVPVFNAVGTVATVMVIFKGARLEIPYKVQCIFTQHGCDSTRI